MSEKLTHKERQKIEETALDWVIRMDEGFKASEKDALETWLNASEFHREIFEQHQWNWNEMDRVAGWHTHYDDSCNPDLLIEESEKNRRLVFPYWWFLTASVAAIFIVSISVIWRALFTDFEIVEKVNKPIFVERLESKRLEDGSVIQLNRDTEIIVDYNHSNRKVTLLHGEANFEVAKDADRPFVVEVSGVEVMAVGTAFNVRYVENAMDVIVTEGVVAVSAKEEFVEHEEAFEKTYLKEYQRVSLDFEADSLSPEVTKVDETTVLRELNWQPSLIDFDNVSLGKIIDEFNGRNKVQMAIMDGTLNSARLSGMFWSDNINGLIRLLESNFAVRAEWGDNETIYLFNNTDN